MRKLLLGLCLLLTITSSAQLPEDIPLQDFLRELIHTKTQDHKIQMVFWLPYEYWEIVGGSMKGVQNDILNDIKSFTRDYVIVAAADGQHTVGEVPTFKSEVQLRPLIKLKDAAGNIYLPIKEEEVDYRVLNLAVAIRPVLVNLSGPLGKGLNFYYFKVQDRHNQNLISATKQGQFSVHIGENAYNWKLPLSTLMPAKVCPVDKEKMRGNWLYCPIHGVQLP